MLKPDLTYVPYYLANLSIALTLDQALFDVLCKYQCLYPSHQPVVFPILQLRKSRHGVKSLAQVHMASALGGVFANILATGKTLLISKGTQLSLVSFLGNSESLQCLGKELPASFSLLFL